LQVLVVLVVEVAVVEQLLLRVAADVFCFFIRSYK
jgi:hypothetical protein